MSDPGALLTARRVCRTLLACVVAVCAFVSQTAAASPTVVGQGLALSCSQPVDLSLRCDYRLTAKGRPLAAAARIGEVALPDPTFAARTGAPTNLSVLLLVDTSDPARAPVIDKTRAHISRLINDAEPHVRFGLASFDSDLEILLTGELDPPERRSLRELLLPPRWPGVEGRNWGRQAWREVLSHFFPRRG